MHDSLHLFAVERALHITRDLLDSGALKRYIDELSITGLTSNPTIFDHVIKNSVTYDAAITTKFKKGRPVEDLTRTADLFRPIYEKTNGVDGWVSLEVPPLNKPLYAICVACRPPDIALDQDVRLDWDADPGSSRRNRCDQACNLQGL